MLDENLADFICATTALSDANKKSENSNDPNAPIDSETDHESED